MLAGGQIVAPLIADNAVAFYGSPDASTFASKRLEVGGDQGCASRPLAPPERQSQRGREAPRQNFSVTYFCQVARRPQRDHLAPEQYCAA
jgi:hypothetical protein